MHGRDYQRFEVELESGALKLQSVRGAAAGFIAQAIKFVLRFASTVLLARLLSPADFGLVAMVAPLVALAQSLNDIGLTQAIVQRGKITPTEISALFWLSALASLALACLLAILAPLISSLYHEPATGRILSVMAILVLVGTLGTVPMALLSRTMRFVAQAGIDVVCTVASVVVSLALAWLGYGYWSLVFGQVAASALNLILAFAFTRWLPSRPAVVQGLGPLVKFGMHLTGVNLATYLMGTADNIIVGTVVGKVGLGLYDRSYALVVQPVGQVIAPIGRIAVPLLSRVNDRPDLYRTAFINLLRFCILLTSPGMLVAIVFAQPIILITLGSAWQAAIPVFAWLCIGGLASPYFTSATWVYVSEGRARRLMIISTITSAISVSSFALGVIWGIYGVAVVSAVSFAGIQTPIMLWGSTRAGLIRFREIAKATAPLLAAAIVTSLILILLPHSIGPLGLAAALLLSYGIFAATVLCLPGGREVFRIIADLCSTLTRARPA